MGKKFIIEFEEGVKITCEDIIKYIKEGMTELGWLITPKIECVEEANIYECMRR